LLVRGLIEADVAETHGIRARRCVGDGSQGSRAGSADRAGQGESALAEIFGNLKGAAARHASDADIIYQPAVRGAEHYALVFPDQLHGLSDMSGQGQGDLFPASGAPATEVFQDRRLRRRAADGGDDSHLALLEHGIEVEAMPESKGGLADPREVNRRADQKAMGSQ